jgi:Protein of unknown function (DUF1573)
MDARRFYGPFLFNSLRRWPFRQMLLIGAAALPFVASFGFCNTSRTAPKPMETVDRPSLVFDQYFVNLSDLHNAARAEAWYHFKNCSKQSIRITNLEPSCGCLDPKVEKREYLPGEECEFSLGVLMTRERPGPHDYSLKIDYEDPKPRSVTIAFKVMVRREVTVRPSQLQFWQNGSEETKQSIVVTDMRPTPFRITGATCKSPLVKFNIGTPIDDPDAGRETTIHVTVAAQVPKEGVRTAIVLTTDDSHYPRIPIAIWIGDWRYPTIQQTSGSQTAGQKTAGQKTAAQATSAASSSPATKPKL